MNWEPVTAISEIVGAIAVIVTLVYLARQIAMSNRFAEAEAWRSRFSEFTSLNAAYGVNPIFYHAMSKVHTGGLQSDLDHDEQALVNSWMVSALQIYEQLLREVKSGILDPVALDEFPGHSAFGMPFLKEQWPFYRRILTPSTVEHMENKYGLK
jgi:hypothetical protein